MDDKDNLVSFKKWLEERGYSPTTIQNFCNNLKSIDYKLGLQVTREEVREAYWHQNRKIRSQKLSAFGAYQDFLNDNNNSR